MGGKYRTVYSRARGSICAFWANYCDTKMNLQWRRCAIGKPDRGVDLPMR